MKKSFLYIFVILMVLSLTLGAVSAEDNATEASDVSSDVAAVPAAGGEEVQNDTAQAAGGDVAASASSVPIADIAVDVGHIDYGDFIVWCVVAGNYGPDTATDVTVDIVKSGNLDYLDVIASQGLFLYGDWYVGSLAPGDIALLYLFTEPLDDGPFFLVAIADSSAYDPDWTNNIAIDFARLDVEDASAATETLPEAGNPIAMALLALAAIGVGGLRRRF